MAIASFKHGNAAARLLEPRSRRLETGGILFLQRGEPLPRVGREWRARISGDLLDHPIKRIADFLGAVDGLGAQAQSLAGHVAPSNMGRAAQKQVIEIHLPRRAGETRT
ncbi:MAG: hypothetical protein WBZ54_05425, partial [Methylocella sp.]